MDYNPRSVPLPIPKPHNTVRDEIGAKILNLLSIIANGIEEYHNPEREFLNDPGFNGNLGEFEGCLISAIMHWTFMFQASELLDEKTIEQMREVLNKNEQYNAHYYRHYKHQYDTSRGLWCFDRDPKEVDLEWIRQNAFQLS